MVDIALYQPDIPQNTGTMLRLGACLGLAVHIIEPAGFAWSDRGFKRAALDYAAQATILRHASFTAFCEATAGRRLVLLTTKGSTTYLEFSFRPDDVLLFGRETAGVPAEVHARAGARLVIPMRPGLRSLNVALACAMAAGEALRQTGAMPPAPQR